MKAISHTVTALFLATLGMLTCIRLGFAEVVPLPGSTWIPPDRVIVYSTEQVTYDKQAGLYTYEYSFRNDVSSPLEVEIIMLSIKGSVLNISAPLGWTSSVWQTGDILDFSANDNGPIPADYVDTGKLLSSPYQIKPGQTLGGFSFQSPDPPAFANFYAQGFTQIPVLGVDVEEEVNDVPPPSDLDESFKGSTKAPAYSDNVFLGGRRPATDGFLAFRNIAHRDVKPAPIQIDLQFAVNGESVDQSSFRAMLNNVDVTSQFSVTGPNTRRAVFMTSQLVLKTGRNVLLTTVNGVIPGTNRTATDVDRISFTVK